MTIGFKTSGNFTVITWRDLRPNHSICPKDAMDRRRRAGLVVERWTPERAVGGSILTQVAMLYP